MDQRETTVDLSHDEVRGPFLERTDAALLAVARGLRPPRLVARRGRGEGEACGFCEMRIACLQGDSTQLYRMRDRARAPRDREDADPLHLLFGATGGPR